jgi:hypothetical protein
VSTTIVSPLSPIGKAALAYATRYSWELFPLLPRHKDHPLVKWGKGATSDPAQITRYWARWPDANIALATGRRSRVVVADIDARSGGHETWADLLDEHAPIDTLEVVTGSGGGSHHVYFEAPDTPLQSVNGGLGIGIDAKADGGYVVLPPSIHPSGGVYAWDTSAVPPSLLPDWLFQLWPKAQVVKDARRNGPGPFNPHYGQPLPKDIQGALADFLKTCGMTAQGDGRYAGPCPFPHRPGPCECSSSFLASPLTGQWWCWCGDHPGGAARRFVSGGPSALLALAGIAYTQPRHSRQNTRRIPDLVISI